MAKPQSRRAPPWQLNSTTRIRNPTSVISLSVYQSVYQSISLSVGRSCVGGGPECVPECQSVPECQCARMPECARMSARVPECQCASVWARMPVCGPEHRRLLCLLCCVGVGCPVSVAGGPSWYIVAMVENRPRGKIDASRLILPSTPTEWRRLSKKLGLSMFSSLARINIDLTMDIGVFVHPHRHTAK